MAALTDPIADLLSRVRNGLTSRHEKIDVPSSRLKIEIARILKDEGYLKNFKVLDDKGAGLLRLYLKYDEAGRPVIHGLSRVSKPGRRLYRGKDGPCMEPPLPTSQWCEPHRTKLFSLVTE